MTALITDDDSSSEDEDGFGCFGEGSWDGLDVQLDVDSGLLLSYLV